MFLLLLVIYLGVVFILCIYLYYRFGELRKPVSPRRCFLIKVVDKDRMAILSFFVFSSMRSRTVECVFSQFHLFICHLFSQDRLSSFFISVHFQKEAIIFFHTVSSHVVRTFQVHESVFPRFCYFMRSWQMLEL